jgi:hypothetical protein
MMQNLEMAQGVGSSIWLSTGFHARPDDGLNLLECVAYVAGLEHSSYPDSACPVISEVARLIAERADERDRQVLVHYILPLSCSAASYQVMFQRLYYLVDFTLRQLAPAVLYYKGQPALAEAMAALPLIRDVASAEAARPLLRSLFLHAYLTPSTVSGAHIINQLESLAGAASRVFAADSDALHILQQFEATLVRFDSASASPLASPLFSHKRVLLENLLCIGPNRQVPPEVIARRRERMATLEAEMAQGRVGRRAGAAVEH